MVSGVGKLGPTRLPGVTKKAPDAAGDRRAHVGVVQIQLGRIDGRAGNLRARLELMEGRAARVPILLRDHVGLKQLLAARGILARELDVYPRADELRLGAGERGLIRLCVHLEQQLALLHQIALVKRGARQIAGGARADLDRAG